jgi:hypothetical protein
MHHTQNDTAVQLQALHDEIKELKTLIKNGREA